MATYNFPEWQPSPTPELRRINLLPPLGVNPNFFIKLTAKDELKVTKIPGVSFFCIFMLQKKKSVKGSGNHPPSVDEG